MIDLRQGDCLQVLKELDDCSVDSIVTDPPYGLSFMGKGWDYDVPTVDVWRECLRVLKPGGHLLAFAGTRTQHRMCVNIEDAGFEIRDMIAWVYGSGLPKSHNLKNDWEGWGTALKPALEPITVARKPFKGTVANNVLEHGTGAINIDGCRVGSEGVTCKGTFPNEPSKGVYGNGLNGACEKKNLGKGRWPANLIHDGSDEVVELFPQTAPAKAAHRGAGPGATKCYGVYGGESTVRGHNDDGGSAARFFYCAKASKKDREDGNTHPTVKPTDLMAYLCSLVTPADGVVLDPFMGSGSTGKAAVREGFSFIGIEREVEYFQIAEKRVQAVEIAQGKLDLAA